MPSIITSLALPPGVQQTANDVVSVKLHGGWVVGVCVPSALRQLGGTCAAQNTTHNKTPLKRKTNDVEKKSVVMYKECVYYVFLTVISL